MRIEVNECNGDISPTMLGGFLTLDQVKVHAFILLPKHREEVCSPSNFFQVSFGNYQYDDTVLI